MKKPKVSKLAQKLAYLVLEMYENENNLKLYT